MANEKITLNTVWVGNAKGNGTIKSDNLQTQIAIPSSKGGSGQGVEPKQLLMSSAASCYLMTLVFMLDQSRISVEELSMETEGTATSDGQISIIHRPHIILKKSESTSQDKTMAESLLHKAEENCHIGQLLMKADVQITLEGNVSLEV
ncbi:MULTISPECIES: OsmC family protein [Paenibacillus]|uniref:OsmC family protein n=1 Tax=Paenibacillus TaxID=44249 RepID=UPI000466E62A|nr:MULTISPECIES: OsmC family protein [Paenibacillus]KGP77720.1 osmotically inducible protein OsmC [Paenibacillus sp. MAEPY2]KGP77974.1 osmotically inducible protein OsmC [Paenibacillus sp. MAEPY1]OZQ62839.1 osmotically inducible protein OsmC [Paenibacillus taichungensis]SFT00185.1 peroxiredoxin, SACOL1771 subfamily [Paenibacillus sp. 453mf]